MTPYTAAWRRWVRSSALVLLLVLFAYGGCALPRHGNSLQVCTSDSDCDDGNPCSEDVCDVSGTCASSPLPDYVPELQVAGDCQLIVCAGGMLLSEPSDDPADDDNACTEDRCEDGEAVHDPVPNDTPCDAPAGAGVCRSGVCEVDCETASDCNDDEPCTEDVCDGSTSVCVHVNIAGPGPSDVEDDCLRHLCQGGEEVAFIDDTDLPPDGICTTGACNQGNELQLPVPAGTGCVDPSDECPPPMGEECAHVCNPFGSCVECLQASDCGNLPADDDCNDISCVAGVCVHDLVAAGTPAGPAEQTDGDCLERVCDGAGNIITVSDPSDPFDDGKICTQDFCDSNDQPQNDPLPEGTSCGPTVVCDTDGDCVGCNDPVDCGSDSFCVTQQCINQTCQPDYTPDGTPLPQQTDEDCLERRRDGVGNEEDVPVVDDPIIDGNPCTEDLCAGGVPQNPNSPFNQACDVGFGPWYCNNGGTCVECNDATQCSAALDCQIDVCPAESCQIDFVPMGDPAPDALQSDGDCQTVVCDGAGNVDPTTVDEPADPFIDGNECTDDECVAGAPDNPPTAPSTPCSTGVCNGDAGMPMCVECAADGDCPTEQQCNTSLYVCELRTGEPCGAPDECFSDFCVDGVCCGTACAGICAECNAMPGTCTAVAFGTDPLNECAAGQCDGNFGCKLDDGNGCAAGSECLSDNCVDGVCCDTLCDGLCEACLGPGVAGVCTPWGAGDDPDGECVDGACNGAGVCAADDGQICSMGSDCLSGNCVDGVCCDSLCDGTCEACDLAGNEGTCSFYTAGDDPEDECTSLMDDVCNGAGVCRCADGVLNGAETDIDCGGGSCQLCQVGDVCSVASDCDSGVCSGTCQAPLCGDGVVNGSEVCDFNAPNQDCCAPDCLGTATAGTVCGPDPDGTGCMAEPTCDGFGIGLGSCIAQDRPDGASCTDDLAFCTGAEQCQAGVCTSLGDPCGTPDDGDINCMELCDEGSDSCVAEPNGTACSDGAYCTDVDTCQAGACVGAGDPCPGADGDDDCSESCNEVTDSCDAADPEGAVCDDGMFCNGADLCAANGTCTDHAGDPCPGADGDDNCAESCDEGGGTCDLADPVDSVCDDGLYCNGTDQCDAFGMCAQHSGDPCPGADDDLDCAESCNESGTSCDANDPDGSSCNMSMSTCAAGVCL